MNTPQRVVKNVAALLLSSVTAHLLNLAVAVVLARRLGPDGFGLISFALAVTTYFALLGNFGVSMYATRELARQPGRVDEMVSSVVSLRLLLAVASFGALAALTFAIGKFADARGLLLTYGAGMFAAALTTDWVFQGLEQMEYMGVAKVAAAIINATLVFALVSGPEDISIVPVFHVSALLGSAALLGGILIRRAELTFRLDLSVAWRLLRKAAPFGISMLLIQLIHNADVVMLGFFRGDAAVGYYSAAYRLTVPLLMLVGIYLDAAFPIMARCFVSSHEGLRAIQALNARLTGIAAAPLVLVGPLVSVAVVKLAYGTRYDDAVLPLGILLLTTGIACVNSVYGRGLWACNRQRLFLRIVALQAAVNLVLNVPLILRYGTVGAASATLAAELVGFLFYYRGFNAVVRVSLGPLIWRSALAAAAVALLTLLAPPLHPALLLGAVAALYLLLVVVLRAIRPRDIHRLREIRGHRPDTSPDSVNDQGADGP